MFPPIQREDSRPAPRLVRRWRALKVGWLPLLAAVAAPVEAGAETWRGLTVAPEQPRGFDDAGPD